MTMTMMAAKQSEEQLKDEDRRHSRLLLQRRQGIDHIGDNKTCIMEPRMNLLPVDTLKKLCLEEFGEYKIQEFRLHGGTESLKDCVDFCFLENGKYDNNRIVWITENAFLRLGSDFGLPGGYRDRQFSLKLWATATDALYSYDQNLRIHSSTTEEAIAALGLLVGLQDSYFKSIKLEYYGGIGRICPLWGRHLENFVRNANRENSFADMTFMHDQCRTLATSEVRTNIGFWHCNFEDGGIAFVEASAARENQESGPAKLAIWYILPFDERNFRVFLSQHNLESLKLHRIPLRREESCRALAAADLQNLEFPACELADGGAALIESVSEGRGPRGLRLGRGQFDSLERRISFINALRGNTYLEKLDLIHIVSGDGSSQALASALLENKGLVHFGLRFCRLDDHCWSELMAAISTHLTLRTLNFRRISDVDGFFPSSSVETRDRTKAIANMLLVNKHIDEIPCFCEASFDRDDWDALVAPRVECNLYRKRLSPIPKIKALSTRAAVVGRALVRVEKNPSLVWMVLSQNHDVICSYCSYLLNEARGISTSVPSRKRSRSPSADAS
jgi:hypothetical protein